MIDTKEDCLFLSWDATECVDVGEMARFLDATIRHTMTLYRDKKEQVSMKSIDVGGQEYVIVMCSPEKSKKELAKIWQTIE